MPEEGVKLSPKASLLSADEIIAIAQIFVELGITRIRLTGGEPLVRKDVGDIMLRLSKLPVELCLTSNALLVHRHLDTLLEAGIKHINISLDTLQSAKFSIIARRDGFAQVMANIDLLLAHKFTVKVNAVLIKGFNDNELIDFIEWTKDRSLQIRFIEFMPFDGNQWQWDKIVPYQHIIDTLQAHYPVLEKQQDGKNDTAKTFRIPSYQGTFGVISSMTEHFCGSCNRLRLTANGHLKNCLFSNNETDLLSAYRQGKDIRPLIQQNLQAKHFKHGGITSLPNLTADSDDMSDRSMILIGG